MLAEKDGPVGKLRLAVPGRGPDAVDGTGRWGAANSAGSDLSCRRSPALRSRGSVGIDALPLLVKGVNNTGSGIESHCRSVE